MKKSRISSIIFGIIMVIVLIFPFYMFSHMAKKKQAQETSSKTTISSEDSTDRSFVGREDTSSETSGDNMRFTWKTVLILSIGVLAAALRFRKMKQMREKGGQDYI